MASQDQRGISPVTPNLSGVQKSVEHVGAGPQYVIVDLPEKKLLQYYPELKGLVPSQSQQDLPKVLEKVGANETSLLNGIPTVCAEEDVVQEQLDKHGFVRRDPVFSAHYSYCARAHMVGEGTRFAEGRIDKNGQPVDPNVSSGHSAGTGFASSGYSVVTGFALLPLHFHPFHQNAANFRYLGRQVLNNQEEYVVAFAQQPQKAELLGSVSVNGAQITIAYQGIAWIDPDKFQVTRMRVDLLKPRPEVGTQTTEVEFSEVSLPVAAKSFWLPREATVSRGGQDGLLREKHQFSDYKIFTKTQPASPK